MEQTIELLIKAEELRLEATKQMAELGVKIFGTARMSILEADGAEYEVVVLSGIQKLAEALGVEPFHPKFFVTDEIDESKLAVRCGNTIFIQSGKLAKIYEWE